jgi:hypothetical protein
LAEEPSLGKGFITKHAKPLTRHSSQSEALGEHGRRLISGVRDGFVVVVRVAIVFMCFKLVEGTMVFGNWDVEQF